MSGFDKEIKGKDIQLNVLPFIIITIKNYEISDNRTW